MTESSLFDGGHIGRIGAVNHPFPDRNAKPELSTPTLFLSRQLNDPNSKANNNGPVV
jgi:hypothetical protein